MLLDIQNRQYWILFCFSLYWSLQRKHYFQNQILQWQIRIQSQENQKILCIFIVSNQSRENQGSCVYSLYPIKVGKARDLVFIHCIQSNSGKPGILCLFLVSNQSQENQGSCFYLLYPGKVRKTRDLVFIYCIQLKSGKPGIFCLFIVSNQTRENQGSWVYSLYPIKVRKTRDLVFVHSKVRKVFPFYIAVWRLMLIGCVYSKSTPRILCSLVVHQTALPLLLNAM